MSSLFIACTPDADIFLSVALLVGAVRGSRDGDDDVNAANDASEVDSDDDDDDVDVAGSRTFVSSMCASRQPKSNCTWYSYHRLPLPSLLELSLLADTCRSRGGASEVPIV